MKRIMAIIALTVVAFWAGLSLGYHEGVNNEQRAWLSTAQDENPDTRDVAVVYKNPHSRIHVSGLGGRVVNRPDPRTFEKYGRSQP
jgi:hypothetical protein